MCACVYCLGECVVVCVNVLVVHVFAQTFIHVYYVVVDRDDTLGYCYSLSVAILRMSFLFACAIMK